MLLHQILENSAQRRPEAEAVRCDGVGLSYGELSLRAYGLAHALVGAGLGNGDRVAVLLAKGLRVPVAFYGVLAAGGTLVPIDPSSPADQIARILLATQVSCIISEPAKKDVLDDALNAVGALPASLGVELAAAARYVGGWEDLPQESAAPKRRIIEVDPCYILHTSGSTGVPKLIRHSHHSAMSFVNWAAGEYQITADDRISNHSSHHTCFATFDYYAAAAAGACTIVLTPKVMMMPASLALLLEQERVTLWYSVPTALVQLLLRGQLDQRDLSALRWVLFAGETFPEKHLRGLIAQLPGTRLSHVYGSTEVNVCTYYHLPESGDFEVPLPIGQPCSNSDTLIEDGELLVRGSTLMTGYWDDEEKNSEVLVERRRDGGARDIYFRTGDRVQLTDSGNLAFDGRNDSQVKVRGHRIELGAVEAALLALDGVEEAIAFTVQKDSSELELVASVVAGSTGKKIAQELRAILPPHAIPARIAVLAEFPRTPTGKIDRNAVQRSVLETA